MAKYEQYAEYKDSEVEWLEKVPSHWQPVPIKYLASEKDTLFLDGDWIESKDISDSGIRYITTGNVGEGQYKEQGTGFISDQVFQKLNCSEVFEQDILISRLNLPIGRACLVPNLNNRIVTSVDNVILRPDTIYCKRFLVHLFSSSEYFHNTANLARGATMQRISRGLLGNIRISLPEKEEQVQIANFLDHETAQIDTLIEKQQTLIQLLKEKRQAVISHAVTKGLNPDTPMKDSGVEWLGEVPEHWELTKIKYIAELTPSKAKILPSLEKRCSFVPMEKLKLDTLILDETRKIKDVYQGYTYFEDDDVLIAKVTPCFENQNMAIAANLVNGIGFGSSEIYVLRTEAEGLNQFLLYRLQESVFMQLGAGAMTGAGGLRRVPSDFINDFQFALPPINEQQEIVAYIEKMKNTFNDLVYKAEQAIQLMQERRTALISAAVTGKIDVRGWRAPE